MLDGAWSWIILSSVAFWSSVSESAAAGSDSQRHFEFSLCAGRSSGLTADSSLAVKSTFQCWTACAQHPTCRTSQVCGVHPGGPLTCSLSSEVYSNCSSLSVDSTCITSTLDNCENGGQFNKTTMVCDCTEWYEGSRCEKVADMALPGGCYLTANPCDLSWAKHRRIESGILACCAPNANALVFGGVACICY